MDVIDLFTHVRYKIKLLFHSFNRLYVCLFRTRVKIRSEFQIKQIEVVS